LDQREDVINVDLYLLDEFNLEDNVPLSGLSTGCSGERDRSEDHPTSNDTVAKEKRDTTLRESDCHVLTQLHFETTHLRVVVIFVFVWKGSSGFQRKH
jgi:hypothetical protein